MKYYVFCSDYDGGGQDEFETWGEVVAFLVELRGRYKNSHGFYLMGVIRGVEIDDQTGEGK